jgi:hypothetical protein
VRAPSFSTMRVCLAWLLAFGVILLSACSVVPPKATQRFDQGVLTLAREGGRCEVTINGVLTQDAIRKLRLVLDAMDTQNCARPVARLQIEDGGLNSAITVGSMLRNRRFDTVIDAHHGCRTACLLVFASGIERVAPITLNNAGFTALAGETPSGALVCINPPTREQSSAVRRYMQAMLDSGATEAVLTELTAARCEAPRDLSAETLRTLGLATVVRG